MTQNKLLKISEWDIENENCIWKLQRHKSQHLIGSFKNKSQHFIDSDTSLKSCGMFLVYRLQESYFFLKEFFFSYLSAFGLPRTAF